LFTLTVLCEFLAAAFFFEGEEEDGF
jgi:hypothetical protein